MNAISESVIEICQDAGMQFKKQGGELYAQCPFHNDGKRPNFRVNIDKNSWFCDVCGKGGGVVEFLAMKQNRPKIEVFKELVGKAPASIEVVASYDYTDRFGNLLYQVCRLQPKSFRQRRPDGKGGWIWNMEGVERVLYHLPQIQRERNKFVWVVEGEKDVETICGIGMTATCNVGGAGKWCEAYSQCFKGKDVILCGDNDEPGRKHIAAVMESLEPFAESIRKIDLPPQFKDVSDFAASFSCKEKFAEALAPIADGAQVMLRGGLLPIKSMSEMEQEYTASVKNAKTGLVMLAAWIPALRCVRPLCGGEVVSIIGDTGTAKTYVLQHLAYKCGVPTLLFELELPDSLTFERFVSIARGKTGQDVFDAYDAGGNLEHGDLRHIYTCSKARVSPQEIESLILKSELKMGMRPTLVLVDYIQLVQGVGKSRYERCSDVAEQLKIVAKNTNTVIVMASQIGRDKDSAEINLHDAKDSGSIENSSGVVIGIWRDPKIANVLKLRVLKNTKGRPSQVIPCTIRPGTMEIVPAEVRAQIDPEDANWK